MKKCLLISAFLLALPLSWGQQTKPPAPEGGRIVTATRLVVLFHDLERQLMMALMQKDQAAVERLLGGDFEVWTPEPPGNPIPRADWIPQAMREAAAVQSFSVQQTSVRGLDNNHAVANFVLLERVGGKQRATFVVDLWAQAGGAWKLTDRYSNAVSGITYPAERKPTGKE